MTQTLRKTSQPQGGLPGVGAWTTMYDKAVYGAPDLLAVHERELQLVSEQLDRNTVLIEVPCATGMLCCSLADTTAGTIGIGTSPNLLHRAVARGANALMLEGEASSLSAVLKANRTLLPDGFLDKRKVVVCGMNRLGTMPPAARATALGEIADLLETGGGKLVLSAFDVRHLGHGLRTIYQTNPDLFGPINPYGDIDFTTGDVHGPAFTSHWFSDGELLSLLSASGIGGVHLDHYGIATLATGAASVP